MTNETDVAEGAGPELSVATPLDVPGQPRLDLDRALEAILIIADEPQSVVHLAAAVARPVAEVRASIARLSRLRRRRRSGEPRTDIAGDGPRHGASVAVSNCARSAAAGASTCAPSTTTLVARLRAHPDPDEAVAGGARDARR